MTELKYILVDDDLVFRELTMQYLSLIPGLELLGTCDNAISAREIILAQHPDMVILDIEMPGLSGLQLLRSLKQIPLTIFISSYPQFAAEAFEVDAIDFLVKPFSPERLIKAVDKVRMLHDMRRQDEMAENLPAHNEDSFFIREKSAYVKILYQEVLYIESMADFVSIFLSNGAKKIALVGLKTLEQQLPGNYFIRISRSHIINRSKITAVENAMIYIDKLRLPIGKSYSEEVVQAIIGNSAIKRFI